MVIDGELLVGNHSAAHMQPIGCRRGYPRYSVTKFAIFMGGIRRQESLLIGLSRRIFSAKGLRAKLG